MRTFSAVVAVTAGFALAAVVSPAPPAEAGQTGVAIDADDIGGVVTGPDGPEAGVWVIGETGDLPTRFNRIVVTDDDGRYVLPDLPDATYDVWVRGYGLVDSAKVQATPGSRLDLTAVGAPDAAAAAQYYPAGHWLSLIEVPGRDEFPGTGPDGNGISPNVRSQAEWMRTVKSGGCTACHALGNKATREVPAELGEFDSMVAAWDRRIQSGQAGGSMSNGLDRMGRRRALEMFADWTDRNHGRRASRRAAPAAGSRAERRRYAMGLGGSEGLSPRRDCNRQAQPDRQRLWADLRRARGERGLRAGPGPCSQRRERGAGAGPRSRHPGRSRAAAGVLALLGGRGDLEQPVQRPQPDARSGGPRLAHLARARAGQPRDVPGRVRASVGARVSQRPRRPAPGRLRPGDRGDDAHRDLLQHAPPGLRRGRERHPLDERGRAGHRLARHEAVPRDR